MESQVTSCSPQNISRASQQNHIAAVSWTTEVDVKEKKSLKWFHFHNPSLGKPWVPKLILKDIIYTFSARSSSSTHFRRMRTIAYSIAAIVKIGAKKGCK